MHEAGHAVIADELRLVTDLVSIREDAGDGRLAFSMSEGESINGDGDADQIRVLYAGLAAERLVRRRARATEGARGDYAKAWSLLPYVAESRQKLEADARRLVVQHRAKIEALADALFERGMLTAGEQEVILESVAAGDDWREWLAFHHTMFAPSAPTETSL
jgi:ATP-dependent Zn protease